MAERFSPGGRDRSGEVLRMDSPVVDAARLSGKTFQKSAEKSWRPLDRLV